MPTHDTLDLSAQAKAIGSWFHNVHLPGGVQTAPDHPLGDFPANKWAMIQPYIPQDLSGARVLDVGCNGGYYAIELARRGAHVLAVDHDERYLNQARFAAKAWELEDRIDFEVMDVYSLLDRPAEQFDYVWFMGVFYHLRYPLLGLDLVCQRVKKKLVFQSLTMPQDDGPALDIPQDCDLSDRQRMVESRYPKMAFIEHRLAGDPTNWWAPNMACVEAILRSCGMRITGQPGHEIVIAEPSQEYRREKGLIENPLLNRHRSQR